MSAKPWSSPDDFQLALRAFALFTPEEKERALKAFAELQYPAIQDRFFEAVYRVIASKESGAHSERGPR